MSALHVRAKREKIVAVADIGSGSAGVAVIAISPDRPARIISVERGRLPFEDRTIEATIAGIAAQLSSAGEKALTAYRESGATAPVSSAYAIIRVPWTRSKTIRAMSKFPEDRQVTDAMITEVAEAAFATLAEGGEEEPDAGNILESSVVRVELNGYPTAHPVGKYAHTLGVSVLVSDCDPRVRKNVVETMSRIFACPPPGLRSGTRALLSVLRESPVFPDDCLIVNMTSNATNLIVVTGGTAVRHTRIPEGVRSIVKRIGESGLPEETLTLIRMLARDQCETEACRATGAAIARAEPELARIFGEAMGRIAATERLPNTLVLAAQEDLAPWLAQFFSRIDFTQFTVTTQPFETMMVTHKEITDMITAPPGITPDAGLSVAGALVNIESRND